MYEGIPDHEHLHVRGSIFLNVGHDERSGSEPGVRPQLARFASHDAS